jgi:hypothetical protein
LGELDKLLQRTTVKKEPEPEPGEEDLGPCAAIVKDKWVTALTIKHPKAPWESFQYRHIGCRSVYDPTRFIVEFVGDADKWRVTVEGRNLFRLYNLVVQHRLEWIRAVDRDFGDDKQAIITGITVEQVEASA